MADEQRHLVRRRLAAQLLSGKRPSDPRAVAERLLAIQAQDLRGAQLAIRSRSVGLHVTDIDRALDDRSMVVTWLNRGTLHLVRSEDYPMLQALTTPQLRVGNARRLRQEGVSPAMADLGVKTIRRALGDEGPLSRAELSERMSRAGVPTKGQALVHILFQAALRGLIVRGPMAGKTGDAGGAGNEQAWVLVDDWLGPQPRVDRVDREQALGELARRYLAGHGPATDRDLAKWAGLPLRDARAGLAAIPSFIEDADGRASLPGRARLAPIPPPRLLGAFEPLLLGWASREFVLGNLEPKLVTDNGLFRPFALVDGQVVATWNMSRHDGVGIHPLKQISAETRTALDRDARAVRRFLDR